MRGGRGRAEGGERGRGRGEGEGGKREREGEKRREGMNVSCTVMERSEFNLTFITEPSLDLCFLDSESSPDL